MILPIRKSIPLAVASFSQRVKSWLRVRHQNEQASEVDELPGEYVNPIDTILFQFYNDLHRVLEDKKMRWLNASVLVFIAILPFNAFYFTIPVVHFSFKYTELAFIAITALSAYAWLKKRIKLRRAYWLYVFLALHAGVQFFSLQFAPFDIESARPAIAAASYALVVFVLVNAIRSEQLIRVALQVMGFSVLIVVIHSLYTYIAQGGVFFTRAQQSIIGNDIGNYLGYLLVMFGTGLVYLFFLRHNRHEPSAVRNILFLLVAAWMYTVVMSGIKIAHISTLLFLFGLIVVLRGRRAWALNLTIVFVAIFLLQINIVSIRNAYRVAWFKFNGGVLVAEETIIKSIDRAGKSLVTMFSGASSSDEGTLIAQESPTGINTTLPPIIHTEPSTPYVPPIPRPIAAREQKREPIVTSQPVSTTQSSPSTVPASPLPPRPPARRLAGIAAPPSNSRPTQPTSLISNAVPAIPPEIQDQLLQKGGIQDFVSNRWTTAEGSWRFRFRGMLAAWYMGLEYPLTGVGPGEQRYFFDHFSEVVREKSYNSSYLSFLPAVLRKEIVRTDKWTISQTNPNNILLMAWAETGILGLAALIGILAIVTFKALYGLWETRTSNNLYTARFLAPSFLTLMVFQLVNPFILHPWFWTTLSLVYVSFADLVNRKPAESYRFSL